MVGTAWLEISIAFPVTLLFFAVLRANSVQNWTSQKWTQRSEWVSGQATIQRVNLSCFCSPFFWQHWTKNTHRNRGDINDENRREKASSLLIPSPSSICKRHDPLSSLHTYLTFWIPREGGLKDMKVNSSRADKGVWVCVSALKHISLQNQVNVTVCVGGGACVFQHIHVCRCGPVFLYSLSHPALHY